MTSMTAGPNVDSHAGMDSALARMPAEYRADLDDGCRFAYGLLRDYLANGEEVLLLLPVHADALSRGSRDSLAVLTGRRFLLIRPDPEIYAWPCSQVRISNEITKMGMQALFAKGNGVSINLGYQEPQGSYQQYFREATALAAAAAILSDGTRNPVLP